jgi:SNF2 family DNA or RNA helicase
VSGSDSEEHKENTFAGFIAGDIRVLVTKPVIGGFGLNLQHCAHQTYFPSHSYEQYYQAVRRCWRFGQTRPVRVDLVMTEGERRVMQNLARKSGQADEMFARLVEHMSRAMGIERVNDHTKSMEVPSWL